MLFTNLKFRISFLITVLVIVTACESSNDEVSLYTGNEVNFELISGEFEGNETSGVLTIKERTDGKGEVEITLNGVINGAVHPVHLHFGGLNADGLVATYLNPIEEINGVGKSNTLIDQLDNNIELNYNSLLIFDGSIKIHFESTGDLKDVILGATNIGLNSQANEAFLLGIESITTCNSDF
jgi:hypothetical protein